MSHSHTPIPAAERDAVLKDIAGAAARSNPTRGAAGIWIALMAIGIAPPSRWMLFHEPQRAWGSWAINSIYWLGIAQGAAWCSRARSGSATAAGAGR